MNPVFVYINQIYQIVFRRRFTPKPHGSFLHLLPISGVGTFPSHDPWNKPFSREYFKDRWLLAGQRIAGNFVGCLEGIQGDQDYIRTMMTPERSLETNQYNYIYICSFVYISTFDFLTSHQKIIPDLLLGWIIPMFGVQ